MGKFMLVVEDVYDCAGRIVDVKLKSDFVATDVDRAMSDQVPPSLSIGTHILGVIGVLSHPETTVNGESGWMVDKPVGVAKNGDEK